MPRQQAKKVRRTTHSERAEAALTLMTEIAATFFRLRAAGARIGAVSQWGGGIWGFLRSLHLDGPATVPQLARARPVTRQRIQKLTDEAAAAGLVALVDNPAHKRSKLVCLTAKGEAVYRQLSERILDRADVMAHDMDEAEMRAATRVLARLRERLSRV